MFATYDNGLVLNIRSAPDGDIVGQIPSGTTVEVESVNGAWCKIDGGYIRADLVTLSDGGDPEAAEPAADCAGDPEAAEDSELWKMTVPQLCKLAADSGIGIASSVTKKADIIAAITA